MICPLRLLDILERESYPNTIETTCQLIAFTRKGFSQDKLGLVKSAKLHKNQ